ncbi:hypothetical protein ACZ90_00355 [Streptomyces albus subsp. albus]|nr:hypothetical protein ACZ90_00355 [Streptomyces albus subsp. albus]
MEDSPGLTGDPFHEGGNQPLASLKGGSAEVHTQQPATSSNSGDTGGNTTAPMTGAWSSTTLGEKPKGTGSNDKAKAH